jgi:drug/metabolite transporter (DMT)-like permease
MERIKMKERRNQAKIAGTAITVCGALIMILVKGPSVKFPWTKHVSHAVSAESSVHNSSHWLLGIIMILLICFSWSGFFILHVRTVINCALAVGVEYYFDTSLKVNYLKCFQSHTLKSYPAELSLTTLICALGTAVALVMEHDMKAWSIGFDMRLFTSVYSVSSTKVAIFFDSLIHHSHIYFVKIDPSMHGFLQGIMCSGVAYYVQGIVIKERGPVYVTACSPLCMIIVTMLGSFILSEVITLGR